MCKIHGTLCERRFQLNVARRINRQKLAAYILVACPTQPMNLFVPCGFSNSMRGEAMITASESSGAQAMFYFTTATGIEALREIRPLKNTDRGSVKVLVNK